MAFCCLLFTVSTASAKDLEPYSLRSIWYIEDAPRPYWEIRVTCNDHKTFRYMVRYNEDDPWCAKQAPDLCSMEKIELAFEVCSGSFDDRVAESERLEALAAEEQARRDALRTELLQREAALQQQRRVIDSRKAELQLKEQALRDRERELAERKARLR